MIQLVLHFSNDGVICVFLVTELAQLSVLVDISPRPYFKQHVGYLPDGEALRKTLLAPVATATDMYCRILCSI